jgi:hypothetical protein
MVRICLPPPASDVSAVSGNSALLGGTDPLAVQQPDNERQDGTDEKARRDGQIEVKVAALDHDVSGQPTKAELAEPRPQEPDDNEHKTNCDKPPAH